MGVNVFEPTSLAGWMCRPRHAPRSAYRSSPHLVAWPDIEQVLLRYAPDWNECRRHGVQDHLCT